MYLIVSGAELTHPDSSSTVEMFDTKSGVWERLPDLLKPRWAHASCTAGDNLFVFCGREERYKCVNSIEMLDLKTRVEGWKEFKPGSDVDFPVSLRAADFLSAIALNSNEIFIL